MKNKDLLLEAVDSYSVYPVKQREILKLLINISIDGIIKLQIPELANSKKISIPTVYKYMRDFEKDGIIEVLNTKKRQLNHFRLNTIKLDEIIAIYLKKKEAGIIKSSAQE